ncbi:uncharacterized protein AC631_01270 [Debaryomyces fabryi]|uniref:Uncharacterized protein n=1 Tax=Debaryomyces fabryi TaxID=58627 RepID=A0A0V1Q3F6_9ASCO|nr:uncharacterized protein AC631_01270 [Debaryomyces fabryi]KSA03015.1 hypothetical protein AC631_01270 [Debaryomyces fabryi]CUM47359.1 unnamed protein product [Debaryomyces fabryi]
MNLKSFFFICIILACLESVIAGPIKVLTPSEDDFYSLPDGYEDKEPGTILKIRKPPQRLRSVYFPILVKDAWQALVRTTDSNGNATAIVTTIIEPFNADPSKVVSYQIMQDSASVNCSPSYSLLYGASMTTVFAQVEMYLIDVALMKGWYVVIPDYEGPKAAFTAGKQSGQSTLDSIRATLKTTNVTGIKEDAKVAMWGYSGGTIATGWAAALQPTYAKELKSNLIGAAMGGFVTNITSTAEGVDGTLFAGLTASAVTGLTQEYPQLHSMVEKLLIPSQYLKFSKAKSLCFIPSIITYAFQHIFTGPKRYVDEGWALFLDPTIKKVIDENTLALKKGDPVPEIPLFVFHGELDTIVAYKDSVRAYNNWCDWGIDSYEFAIDETTGHITEFIEGSPAAIAWLTKMFNGEKPVKGCKSTKRFTNLLYPGANTSVADVLSGSVKTIFGENFGPNAENIGNGGRNMTHVKRSLEELGVPLDFAEASI